MVQAGLSCNEVVPAVELAYAASICASITNKQKILLVVVKITKVRSL